MSICQMLNICIWFWTRERNKKSTIDHRISFNYDVFKRRKQLFSCSHIWKRILQQILCEIINVILFLSLIYFQTWQKPYEEILFYTNKKKMMIKNKISF